MHIELSIAMNFLMSYLYNKLPRRRIEVFSEELKKGLLTKFQDHWYPEDSFKGSGFRSIRIIEGKLDPTFKLASQSSGLPLDEILEQLPKGLTIWIDPDEVSYRIGETGQVMILYYNSKRNLKAIDHVLEDKCAIKFQDSLNKDNQPILFLNGLTARSESYPINTLNNSTGGFSKLDQDFAHNLEKLKIDSPPGGFNFPYLQNFSSVLPNVINIPNGPNLLGVSKPNINQTCFTAAAFAQTKFGSTKMKTHSNHQTRPTKLFSPPPTDLHNHLNLAAQLNVFNARSPGSFIPSGLHSQFFEPWSSFNQTSAPSSSLTSPSTDPVPTANNQCFTNLLNQSNEIEYFEERRFHNANQQHLFEGMPNSIITKDKSNINYETSKMPLICSPDSKIISSTLETNVEILTDPKTAVNVLCTSNKETSFEIQHLNKNNKNTQLNDNFVQSTTLPSSMMAKSSSSDANAKEWNNYISTLPNLKQLLVAN